MIFTILFFKKIKQIFKSNFMYKKIILKLFRKRIFLKIIYKESYSNSKLISEK